MKCVGAVDVLRVSTIKTSTVPKLITFEVIMKRFQQILLTSCLLASSISYAQSFQVTSPDIKQGKLSESQVFNGFACTGQHTSPALASNNAPKNT